MVEAGLRAGLIVPLFGGEGALGALVLQRRRIGVGSRCVGCKWVIRIPCGDGDNGNRVAIGLRTNT